MIIKLKLKKIIFIIIIYSFFFSNSFSKSYRIGDKIEDEIEFYKKYKFELPPGNWTVGDRFAYEYYSITSKGYILLKLIDKKAIEIFTIGELDTGPRFQSAVNDLLYTVVFKNKYDGCYERPEYFILEFFSKGSSHNCFWIGHEDVYKELFNPDDPELRGVYAQFKGWLRDTGVTLPKIVIGSSHSYFSRLTGGKWFVINHAFDPEALGAPKSKFINEDRSEYHKFNISNYPEHKKILDKVVSLGAKRHKQFELEVRAKEHHKLNLNSYISNSKSENTDTSNKDILSQINKLNELYNSGVLTEKEFKKAKEKILNQ